MIASCNNIREVYIHNTILILGHRVLQALTYNYKNYHRSVFSSYKYIHIIETSNPFIVY